MRKAEIDANSMRSSRFPRWRSSSILRSSAIPAACMCGSPSRLPPIWSRRSCSSTRYWPSATRRFRRSAWARCNDGVHGRTIVFVSHNMASVKHLCSRAILLASGRIAAEGPPSDVIRSYLSDVQQGSSVSIRDWQDRSTSGEARIVKFEVRDGCGRETNNIPICGSVRFSFHVEVYKPLVDPCFGVLVHRAEG